MTPSGKFAYVTNFNSDTISEYSIASGGTLSTLAIPTAPTGHNPAGLTVDPNGSFLYVANLAASTVSAYGIDSTTGQLTSLGSPAHAGATIGLASVAVDPSARFLYAVQQNESRLYQFKINSNGSLSSMAMSSIATGLNPSSVTVDPTGKYVYVANGNSQYVTAYSINNTTGQLTALNTAGTSGSGAYGPTYIAVDPGKHAYVTSANSYTISQYAISGNGTLTPLGTATLSTIEKPYSISVDSSGKFVYVTSANSNDLLVYSINGTSGELTAIGTSSNAGRRPSFAAVTKPIR